MHSIEFQKRGLPHAHILAITEKASKPRTVEDYDRVACADVPDPDAHPQVGARRRCRADDAVVVLDGARLERLLHDCQDVRVWQAALLVLLSRAHPPASGDARAAHARVTYKHRRLSSEARHARTQHATARVSGYGRKRSRVAGENKRAYGARAARVATRRDCGMRPQQRPGGNTSGNAQRGIPLGTAMRLRGAWSTPAGAPNLAHQRQSQAQAKNATHVPANFGCLQAQPLARRARALEKPCTCRCSARLLHLPNSVHQAVVPREVRVLSPRTFGCAARADSGTRWRRPRQAGSCAVASSQPDSATARHREPTGACASAFQSRHAAPQTDVCR